jgi:hypothetical protein
MDFLIYIQSGEGDEGIFYSRGTEVLILWIPLALSSRAYCSTIKGPKLFSTSNSLTIIMNLQFNFLSYSPGPTASSRRGLPFLALTEVTWSLRTEVPDWVRCAELNI